MKKIDCYRETVILLHAIDMLPAMVSANNPYIYANPEYRSRRSNHIDALAAMLQAITLQGEKSITYSGARYIIVYTLRFMRRAEKAIEREGKWGARYYAKMLAEKVVTEKFEEIAECLLF